MRPVLGWEVVEGEQAVAVLVQAGSRLLVLGLEGLDEEIEGPLGLAAEPPFGCSEVVFPRLRAP